MVIFFCFSAIRQNGEHATRCDAVTCARFLNLSYSVTLDHIDVPWTCSSRPRSSRIDVKLFVHWMLSREHLVLTSRKGRVSLLHDQGVPDTGRDGIAIYLLNRTRLFESDAS